MTTEREIKDTVRERYAESARQVAAAETSCCGSAAPENVISSKLYTTDELQGLPQEAVVASLGCGSWERTSPGATRERTGYCSTRSM